MNNTEQSPRPSVPLLRGSEEQVVKLRKRLEEVFSNVSLARDVVTVCVELSGQGNSGDFNAEIARVLRRCAADGEDLQARQARIATNLGQRLRPVAARHQQVEEHEVRPLVRRASGVLVLDDTVLDKGFVTQTQ